MPSRSTSSVSPLNLLCDVAASSNISVPPWKKSGFPVPTQIGEDKTAGGIIIPDSAKEKPSEGEILSV
jgi:Chaperonin 10 Kd subunit